MPAGYADVCPYFRISDSSSSPALAGGVGTAGAILNKGGSPWYSLSP
jgi:hypothetical protein